MPPVSRFGGGKRAEKKQTVVDKLKGFFSKFFGVANGSFVEERKESYLDVDALPELLDVAEKVFHLITYNP